MKQRVLFGFEAGTGRQVELEVTHIIISGLTRASGKTTALRALAERSGARVLAFEVKPGAQDFLPYGRTIPVFLRGSVDDLTLKEMLERKSRMGLKKEFPFLIDACRGARHIKEVLANIRKRLEPPPPVTKDELAAGVPKPKRLHPLERNSLIIVESLLAGLIEEIGQVNPVTNLDLRRGLNVMDIRNLSDEFQQLVVRATIDYLYESETNVVVALDEAHKFIPEHQPSAAKASIIRLVKEGGARNLWVWMSTQALTSISKQALKQAGNWILGRQMELLEVERTIAQIPVAKNLRPKPESVMKLGVGYFIVASGEAVIHAYSQPSWLTEWGARQHAVRGFSAQPPPAPQHSNLPVAQVE